MNATRERRAAMLLYFAMTSAFGIVAHLCAELAGLGLHDGADLIFSARHGYLALFAFSTFVAIATTIARTPQDRRRARVARLVDALPFKTDRLRFLLVSFGAQFGFFALTQIGEGCPLCSGDVVVGIFAAAVASLVGAAIVLLGKRRMLDLAFALFEFLAIETPSNAAACDLEHDWRIGSSHDRRRTTFAFRYRPPPLRV